MPIYGKICQQPHNELLCDKHTAGGIIELGKNGKMIRAATDLEIKRHAVNSEPKTLI